MKGIEKLSELVKVPTVSNIDPALEDNSAFERIPGLLAELFPSAHKAMERELIGDRAIVYKWEGRDSSVKPVLCMAHYDVVPAGDESKWEKPPFSGEISGGRIYGRGSLDDKGMLAAWMEAADKLARSGFKPERTVYFAFGGDEEVIGNRGAAKTAAVFKERGITFDLVLDEGGAIVSGQMDKFTDKPVALLGTSEKGYLTIKITAEGMPGHSSAPPEHTAIGRLSRVLAALEAEPFPAKLTAVPKKMLSVLGNEAGGVRGFFLNHPGLIKSSIIKGMLKSPSQAGMVRTTTALTVVNGGEKANVLPDTAYALVNFRILPGESVDSTVNRVKEIILKTSGNGVSVEVITGNEPVESSPLEGDVWDFIESKIKNFWPDTVVVPFLVTATTDSRHYSIVSDNIYRFIPMQITDKEIKGIHAFNESVPVDQWERMVDFLESVISWN